MLSHSCLCHGENGSDAPRTTLSQNTTCRISCRLKSPSLDPNGRSRIVGYVGLAGRVRVVQDLVDNLSALVAKGPMKHDTSTWQPSILSTCIQKSDPRATADQHCWTLIAKIGRCYGRLAKATRKRKRPQHFRLNNVIATRCFYYSTRMGLSEKKGRRSENAAVIEEQPAV